MKTMINEEMMELELDELKNIAGGMGCAEAFDVYAEYLNTLFAKYNVKGVRNVKKVCTPEEKAKIKELYHAWLYADDLPQA